MTDANATAGSLASAAQSLRDTAKWIAGGVAATSAAVFAGSSLTALGSLALTNIRLYIAGGGALLGFLGLAVIMSAAISVLTRFTLTFRQFAVSNEQSVISVRNKLQIQYQGDLRGAADFAAFAKKIDTEFDPNNAAPNTEFRKYATDLAAIVRADAGFHLLEQKYKFLLLELALGTPLAIVGFGIFAWAANPKSEAQPAAPVEVHCK